MDLIIVNEDLLVTEYHNDRQLVIKKNIANFIKAFLNKTDVYKTIKEKLEYNELDNDNFKCFKHEFSKVYSSDKYVNYKNLEAVKLLENEATLREKNINKLEFLNKKNIFYFLNPILYPKILDDFDKIGALLYFTAGMKCGAEFKGSPHIKKFIPSNGARYPFTPYIFIKKHSKLRSGVYEYNMIDHALIKIPNVNINKKLKQGVIQISYLADVERVMQRYPNSINYRDLLFDLGHLIQNLKLCLYKYKLEEYCKISIFNYDSYNLMTPNFIDLFIYKRNR